MAPKKQQKSSGFMIFTLEWKQKHGRGMPLQRAVTEAGKIWANMDATKRAPYNTKAKEERVTSRNMSERLTCTGLPISQIDRERMDQEQKERSTKRDIEATVNRSVKNARLEHQSYYFIMANYFSKTMKGGVYIPAEIAVCEFSLKQGVSRLYQTHVNPGVTIYGHQYEAQHHSETTHNLPLPPNAIGDKNLGKIYNDILNFIRDNDGNYPPLYTLRNSIQIIESVFEYLKEDGEANDVNVKVYPIEYLFFIMKEATTEAGELEKPSSFYITDAYFERDFFEFQIGIACQFHEENDKCKYCTQSYVTRWGYMFAEYMCKDIAIPLIPGRHCPMNTNLNAIITPAPSTYNDNVSSISMDTATSCATKALASSKVYYDVHKNMVSEDVNSYSNDFPSLSATRPKKKAQNSGSLSHSQKTARMLEESYDTSTSEDLDDLNPWKARSHKVPERPETKHFEIDFKDDTGSEFDDHSTLRSFGRGRCLMNSSMNSTKPGSYYGRGSQFRF